MIDVVSVDKEIRALLEESARRDKTKELLFREQRDAVEDPAQLRAWQTSRRSGKTTAAMIEFIDDGSRSDAHEYAYIALTRSSAERIAWGILKGLDRELGLDCWMQPTKLRATLKTDSAITFYGADRPDWLDRLYGQKLKKVWIDEAAFYTVDLERFVYDVLQPCVTDLRGSITLMSRPGNACRGFFYDVCVEGRPGWSVKKWTWRENPHIRSQTQELIDTGMREDPNFLSLPNTRVNWNNEWVEEGQNPVYLFDKDKNSVDDHVPTGNERFVLGVDFGWTDATAMVIGCWSDDYPEYVELESFKKSRLTIDEVASKIKVFMQRYPGILIIGDPAQKHAFEEIKTRYQIPIQAADKADKRFWIDCVNSELGLGRYKIVKPEDSQHVQEMKTLTWEVGRTGDVKEARNAPNDCCDAALYAFRSSYHFRYRPKAKQPKFQSKEYWDAKARDIEKEAEAYFATDEAVI